MSETKEKQKTTTKAARKMVDAVGLWELNWQLVSEENQFISQRQVHSGEKSEHKQLKAVTAQTFFIGELSKPY